MASGNPGEIILQVRRRNYINMSIQLYDFQNFDKKSPSDEFYVQWSEFLRKPLVKLSHESEYVLIILLVSRFMIFRNLIFCCGKLAYDLDGFRDTQGSIMRVGFCTSQIITIWASLIMIFREITGDGQVVSFSWIWTQFWSESFFDMVGPGPCSLLFLYPWKGIDWYDYLRQDDIHHNRKDYSDF